MQIRTFEPLSLPTVIKVKGTDGTTSSRTCRLVVLDATANKALIEKCVGRPLTEVRQRVQPAGRWMQVDNMRLPKATLLHDSEARRRWVDRVAKLVRRWRDDHGSVLVITHLDFEFALREELKDEASVTITHYYGVRGRSLENHDACILVGFPQPPRESVYMDAAAIWQGEVLDQTWEPHWWPYFDVTGPDANETWSGSELVMPRDQRLRVIWRLRSVDELYQAAFRVRGLTRQVPTLLLTSAPTPPDYKLPVELLGLDDLDTNAGRPGVRATVQAVTEKLKQKLGWASSHLVQATLGHDADLYGPVRLVGGLDQLGYPAKWKRLLEGGPAKLPKVSPRRVREIWAELREAAVTTPTEVSFRVPGQPGRPLGDEVEGDLDAWFRDHEEVFRDLGVVVMGLNDDGILHHRGDAIDPGIEWLLAQDP